MESEIGKKSRELTTFSIDLSSIDNLHKNICEELAELSKDIAEEDTRKRVNGISLKLRQQTANRLNEASRHTSTRCRRSSTPSSRRLTLTLRRTTAACVPTYTWD